MCGLIGYIGKNNKGEDAGRHVINQYQDQMTRGQKGFGVIEIYKDKINIERATEPTKAIIDARLSKAPIMFFHHRQPTSTENTMRQTHPFFINHDELEYTWCVMHNGVIRNKDELFKYHAEELGYVYSTFEKGTAYQYSQYSAPDKFNDSEALAIEVARFFEGESNEIGTIGTAAFMAIKLDKKTQTPIELVWGRNSGNPLECLESEHGVLIASSIENPNAEIISHDTFEVLDLQKYFASKAKTVDVYKSIKAGDVKFKEEPKPVVTTPTTTSRMGFGTQPATTTPTTTKTNSSAGEAANSAGKVIDIEDEIDDSDYGYQAPLTPREKAFQRMGERIAEEAEDMIMEFFANLAYTDMADDEVMQLASNINDLILEKTEISRDKVRPFFDRKEERELDELVDEDTDYSSVNERADASAERFADITGSKTDVVF